MAVERRPLEWSGQQFHSHPLSPLPQIALPCRSAAAPLIRCNGAHALAAEGRDAHRQRWFIVAAQRSPPGEAAAICINCVRSAIACGIRRHCAYALLSECIKPPWPQLELRLVGAVAQCTILYVFAPAPERAI